MLKKIFSIKLTLLFLVSCVCLAEDDAGFDKEAFIRSADTDTVINVGIFDCIRYALENNSEIKIKRLDVRIADDYMRMANAAFEPILTADYSVYDSTKETTTLFGYADLVKFRDINFNGALMGTLPTGTEYNISFLNKEYESNSTIQRFNPYYTANPKVSLTQPVLKGFGMLVNRADVIIAKNNKEQSISGFKNMVMDIVTNTQIAYYNYQYARDSYEIAKSSLDRARDLLTVSRARYEKGLVSSVDLLETEAAVADKEKMLIAAESGLTTAEDNLKLITNLVDNPELWNATLKLADITTLNPERVDIVASLQKAFVNRPDYEAAKIDLKSRDIKVKAAQNGLLPIVDLVGSYGLNGLGKDYRKAVDGVDKSYKDWSLGVKFSLPWGGGDRAKYDQTKAEKARALIAFKRLEQNIILEVRNKVRAVDIQDRQLKAAILYKEKETQNYQAQKERYAAGQVSTHEMLEYQDKLTSAELGYTRALIDYNISIIALDKSQGLTLTKNSIALEEQW